MAERAAIEEVFVVAEGAEPRETPEVMGFKAYNLLRMARIGLPVNVYTEWYWKCDLHNILHFLSLRMDARGLPAGTHHLLVAGSLAVTKSTAASWLVQ